MMSPDVFMKYAREYIIETYYKTKNGKSQTTRTNAIELISYMTVGSSYRAFFHVPSQCDAMIFECMYDCKNDSFVCNSFLRLNHKIEDETTNKYRLLMADQDAYYKQTGLFAVDYYITED